MNIIFGTIKKAGRGTTSNEKYPNQAVITIEGIKGEGKSRRILFNSKSMELLDAPVGVQQSVIFGFVEADENLNRKLLVANADMLPGKENTVVYSLSKNKVAFESTKEKGKGISNSPLHGEITDFLQIDANEDNEFELQFFADESGLKLYELVSVIDSKKVLPASGCPTHNIEESSIEEVKKSFLTYTTYDEKVQLLEDSLDNDNIEFEKIEDLSVRHREIEEVDEDIKSQNAELENVAYESSAVEGGFESNLTENTKDWE